MPKEQTYTLRELAGAVNAWCETHSVAPLNAQAADELNERSIRYYRTLGLVDAPRGGGAGAGYGEKHFLQLVAIRLLQAQGQPLRKIQELLYGRTLEDLLEIRRRGLKEARPQAGDIPSFEFSPREQWHVIGLDARFALLSRSGPAPSPGQLAAIRQILHPEHSPR